MSIFCIMLNHTNFSYKISYYCAAETRIYLMCACFRFATTQNAAQMRYLYEKKIKFIIFHECHFGFSTKFFDPRHIFTTLDLLSSTLDHQSNSSVIKHDQPYLQWIALSVLKKRSSKDHLLLIQCYYRKET